jgi:hypothetical protein
MFRIQEIIRPVDGQLSKRCLPLEFPERAEAVVHIELLQAQFMLRGYDQHCGGQKNENVSEIYQWVIEDETVTVVLGSD